MNNALFSRSEIMSFFDVVRGANLKCILLRNLADELPNRLSRTKDIDILVSYEDVTEFELLLFENGWKRIPHPYRNVPFLYSMHPFRFYDKDGLHIDVHFELACRSLFSREWFPLDQKIQDDAWTHRIRHDEVSLLDRLSKECEIVHLLTRCVFDKGGFNDGYISRIKDLWDLVDINILETYLELVFFKFTKSLMGLIQNDDYSLIIDNYKRYKLY